MSLLLTTTAHAQQGPEFSADRIKADVTYLADDLLEGRNAGARGYDIAAKFVASRYSSLGLQPANNGSYLQDVPFVIATLKPDAKNTVWIGDRMDFPTIGERPNKSVSSS